MNRKGLIALALMLVSLPALAGKEERDYLKNEVTPKVKAAEAKFKESCGCALKITINDNTTKTKDDLSTAKSTVNVITDNAPAYCTDDASKKAVCQLKSLEVAKGKEPGFTFKGGKGVSTHDGQGTVSWDMMMRVLDK
jgi:hypothetical protein